MKEIRKVQLIQLDSLKELDRICRKNGLRYYLIGGSLIGAIRHKGFIPWDDDIDIAMPREDYDKLIDIFNNECTIKGMSLQNYKNNPEMRCYFSRIIYDFEFLEKNNLKSNDTLGMVAIDILPLDGVPNNILSRKWYYFKCMFFRMLAGSSNLDVKKISNKRSTMEKIILKFFLITGIYKKLNKIKIYEKLDKLYKKNKWNECEFSGTITGAYKIHEIVQTKYWGNGTEYEFENCKFFGPDDYDAYLTHMYGDYMTLPPEEKRKSHFDD